MSLKLGIYGSSLIIVIKCSHHVSFLGYIGTSCLLLLVSPTLTRDELRVWLESTSLTSSTHSLETDRQRFAYCPSMTLSKQLLGFYHWLVFVWVDHLSKTVLIINEFLTTQRSPIARDLLCFPYTVLVRRLLKIFMTTLTSSWLLETRVESFKWLISAFIFILIPAMGGDRFIICAVSGVFLHLLELIWGMIFMVLACTWMLSKWYLLIAIVTELLLRAWLVDHRVNIAGLVSLRSMLGRCERLFRRWGDDILAPDHAHGLLFCSGLWWLLDVALLRAQIRSLVMIERCTIMVVTHPGAVLCRRHGWVILLGSVSTLGTTLSSVMILSELVLQLERFLLWFAFTRTTYYLTHSCLLAS